MERRRREKSYRNTKPIFTELGKGNTTSGHIIETTRTKAKDEQFDDDKIEYNRSRRAEDEQQEQYPFRPRNQFMSKNRKVDDAEDYTSDTDSSRYPFRTKNDKINTSQDESMFAPSYTGSGKNRIREHDVRYNQRSESEYDSDLELEEKGAYAYASASRCTKTKYGSDKQKMSERTPTTVTTITDKLSNVLSSTSREYEF